MALLPLLAGCAAVATAPDSGRPPETAEARCQRGLAAACRDLGRSTLLADGPGRDDRMAAAWAMKACEMGEAGACSDLGVLAAIGRGVPQADARAAALARRACDSGFALACSNLGALTVEGANTLTLRPEEAGEEGQRIVRLLSTGCDAGAPEGCLNLGTVLEAGRLVPLDSPGAARAYRRGCQGGLALACHRLALLAADRPGAAPGADVRALQGAACQAAIGPACAAVQRPVPPRTARTPVARLVEDRRALALGIPGAGGFSPAELWPAPSGPRLTRDEARRPTAAQLAQVPPGLRGRLGLDQPARPDGGDPAGELLVALRRMQLGGCYELPRSSPGVRATLLASFLVDSDGRPTDVRPAAMPPDPELEACAAEVIAGWEFPVAAAGYSGPYLAGHVFDPSPAGPPPAYTPPDGLRPALRRPGCVEGELRLPAEARGAIGSVTVKVAVDGSGAPVLFHGVTPVPDPVLAAVEGAVRRCDWLPGADGRGRPATYWVTLTVKLGER
jgi:TPR repeat protein